MAFLIDRWDPERGGAERALALFAEHLIARGHEVHAFARAARAGAPGKFHAVAAAGISRRARERRFARRAVRAARAIGCDVTIGVRHLLEVDLYWPHGGVHRVTWAARRKARGLSPKESPGGRHRAFVEFERELYARGGARRVVCVSELVREEIVREWPLAEERLVVIENGVDLERFHPRARAAEGARLRAELALADTTPLVVFGARDPELKGLDTLLRALARLQDRPWHLLVAGVRRPGAWADRARGHGLPAFRFDVRPAQDPVALWSAADLFALPTWRDPAPLALLEALACGTPVVTTACAGNAERVRGAAGVVLARPGDVDALAAALAERCVPVTPAVIESARAAVEDRGIGPWMERLEDVVLALDAAPVQRGVC